MIIFGHNQIDKNYSLFFIISEIVNANRVTKTSRDGWQQNDEDQSNAFIKLVINSMFNRAIL